MILHEVFFQNTSKQQILWAPATVFLQSTAYFPKEISIAGEGRANP